MEAEAASRQMGSPDDTTLLLRHARGGDRQALGALFERVHAELRSLAHMQLRRRSPGQTLSTTGLVHEAYLRLVDARRAEWKDRAHFLALASQAMRYILVDAARARTARKRGGGETAVPLDEVQLAAGERAADLLALDEALEQLARGSERLSRVVEYRFFGGLTFEEIAEVTGLSVPTVKRDWTRARLWLHHALRAG